MTTGLPSCVCGGLRQGIAPEMWIPGSLPDELLLREDASDLKTTTVAMERADLWGVGFRV